MILSERDCDLEARIRVAYDEFLHADSREEQYRCSERLDTLQHRRRRFSLRRQAGAGPA